MDDVFEVYPEERDRTHEPRLFESVALACEPADAVARVAEHLPWLVREETRDGTAFRSPRHRGTPVVAVVTGPRHGHGRSHLRYRVAYRADPPLGSTYDAPAGRQVLAALEPCLPGASNPDSAPRRPARVPRRWLR